MSRVSDERLERLIELWRPEITGTGDFGEATELCAALRELKSYRKAVREYFAAREVPAQHSLAGSRMYHKRLDEARANLRALERGEGT